MANKATAEKVAADMRPPDYRYAVQTIRGGVNQKKTKVSSLNGEIGDLYSKIESKGVHPKAAKFWASVDKLEPVERMQIMRSFNGMCDASGWPEVDGDMVDTAEGKVVHMRMNTPDADESDENADGTDGEHPGDDEEGDEDDDEEPEPVKAGRKRSGLETLRAVKARMNPDESVVHAPMALDAEQRRAKKVQDLRQLGTADPDFV